MSSSDNEVTGFKVNDEDLEFAWNPHQRRRKITKEEAIYGIWADNDNNYDRKNSKNYRDSKKANDGPIDFIESKIQIEKETTEASKISNETKKAKTSTVNPSCTMPKTSFGSWEKHTTGFGLKMLKKMGFEPGKGLGKDGEGISTPIEIVQRKGRGALGAYGPENKKEQINQTLKDQTQNSNHIKNDNSALGPPTHLWKKHKNKNNASYVYKTLETLIESDSKNQIKSKIIDMTGPDIKVVDSLDQLGHSAIKKDSSFNKYFKLPELEHNINLIVKTTEKELLKQNKILTTFENDMANLQKEKNRMIKIVEREYHEKETLEKILEFIKKISHTNNHKIDLVIIESYIDELYEYYLDYKNEFKLYDLFGLFNDLIINLCSSLNWKPLKEDYKSFLNTIKKWQSVIEVDQSNKTLFEKFVWRLWERPINCAVQEWDAEQADIFIDLLVCFKDILSERLLNDTLDLIVLKLKKKAEDWKPFSDVISIHIWIGPWKLWMNDKLENIMDVIVAKIMVIISNWNVKDNSLIFLLNPMKNLFSTKQFEIIIRRGICPKISTLLDQIQINPRQQNLDAFKSFYQWNELIPIEAMAQMLELKFFPKWIDVLFLWLSNNANLNDVAKWYTGWKTLFGDKMNNNPTIKIFFNKALYLMNAAASNNPITNINELPSFIPQIEPNEIPKNDRVKISSTSTSFNSIKDIIELKAGEYGFLFKPIESRRIDGKQVYKLHNVLIYIDRNVIFVQNEPDKWTPISMDSIFSLIYNKF